MRRPNRLPCAPRILSRNHYGRYAPRNGGRGSLPGNLRRRSARWFPGMLSEPMDLISRRRPPPPFDPESVRTVESQELAIDCRWEPPRAFASRRASWESAVIGAGRPESRTRFPRPERTGLPYTPQGWFRAPRRFGLERLDIRDKGPPSSRQRLPFRQRHLRITWRPLPTVARGNPTYRRISPRGDRGIGYSRWRRAPGPASGIPDPTSGNERGSRRP